MFKSAIRVNKIKTVAQLRGASLHAQRRDETSRARIRDGAEAGEALAWSKAEDDRDYLTAFKAHKIELGAGERKNAPLALQALCVVSPEWVQQTGDLHDRNNPRNIALFEQAKAWAESWAGEGSVFGARLDLDEKGGAVVDLMIAPVRDSRGKAVISTQKPLTELKTATDERNEFSALQTSWAEWCREHLDENITRGLRRELTAREHLSPETYGQIMDKARNALQRPVESVVEALQGAGLSEADTSLLRDYLLLRGEVIRHKQAPADYKPPEGDFDREYLDELIYSETNTWKIIDGFRKGADKVIDAARNIGIKWGELRRPDGHEAGRKWFPDLADRLHMGAVLAKCAEFFNQAEVLVKGLRIGDPNYEIPDERLGLEGATELVDRYNRHLGLERQDKTDHVVSEETLSGGGLKL